MVRTINNRGPYSSPLQQKRKQRILEVAGEQLNSQGVSKLTMRGVAEASGVSLKTLYNLFGSRDLLILRVATGQLNSLELSPGIKAAEPGISQLLAYAEEAMALFSGATTFSAIAVGILLRIENEISPADDLMAIVRDLTYAALIDAKEREEIADDVDIDSLSILLCSQQWGLVVMWKRGLLSLEQLKLQLPLSHCLTLIPLSRDRTMDWLSQKSQALLGQLNALNSAPNQLQVNQ